MSDALGPQGFSAEDRRVIAPSRFSDVRKAIFDNPYQKVWGAPGEKPLERFAVTLGPLLRGMLPGGKSWLFLDAAKRVLVSDSDLRWGVDGKGFERLLHKNAICLTGTWEITEETPYTGYFRKGSRGLLVARYSVAASETRRGHTRSQSMVARVYPTTEPNHPEPLPTGCFITQEDFGGESSRNINEVRLRNAPNTTAHRRGLGLPILMMTGIVLGIAEKKATIRQLYQLAELGKPPGEKTSAPEFMQLSVAQSQPVIPGDDLDFRDEIMAQIYDPGDPAPKRKLVFDIETSDDGKTVGLPVFERRIIKNWRRIGRITFDEAVVSFNGDHVLHINHPSWREDRNDPSTVVVTKV